MSRKTPVVFRKWNNGDIIALFPMIQADNQGLLCTSYMHIGQHGGASYWRVIAQTVPATPAEYADLLVELKAIGYDNLRVMRRRSSRMSA